MDINDLRAAVTVAGLVLFVALMAHTWSRSRRAEHEEAAMLPFAGEPAAGVQGVHGVHGANDPRGETP